MNREDNDDDSMAGLYTGGNTKKVVRMKEETVRRQKQREAENVNYRQSSGRKMYDEFVASFGKRPMTVREYRKKLREYQDFQETGFTYASIDESVFEGGVSMLASEPLLSAD